MPKKETEISNSMKEKIVSELIARYENVENEVERINKEIEILKKKKLKEIKD